MILKFGIPSFGGAVAEGNVLFAVSQKTKKLHQISLPDEIPQKVCIAVNSEKKFSSTVEISFSELMIEIIHKCFFEKMYYSSY